MRNISRGIWLLSAPLVFAACNPFATDPQICHDGIYPAFFVEMRDSLSGEAVPDVVGIARKGSYEETLEEVRYVDDGILSVYHRGVGSGPGLYDLEFAHPDYKTWRKTIMVPPDQCAPVRTSDLEFVLLQPREG
jgi:hypothetical protein